MKKPFAVQMPSEASEKKNVPTFKKKGRSYSRKQRAAIIIARAKKGK